jgi:hypothetical protein
MTVLRASLEQIYFATGPLKEVSNPRRLRLVKTFVEVNGFLVDECDTLFLQFLTLVVGVTKGRLVE